MVKFPFKRITESDEELVELSKLPKPKLPEKLKFENKTVILTDDESEEVGFDTEFEASYFYNVATYFQKQNPNTESFQIEEFCQEHANIKVEDNVDLMTEVIKLYGTISESDLCSTIWEWLPNDYVKSRKTMLQTREIIAEIVNGHLTFIATDEKSMNKVTKN